MIRAVVRQPKSGPTKSASLFGVGPRRPPRAVSALACALLAVICQNPSLVSGQDLPGAIPLPPVTVPADFEEDEAADSKLTTEVRQSGSGWKRTRRPEQSEEGNHNPGQTVPTRTDSQQRDETLPTVQFDVVAKIPTASLAAGKWNKSDPGRDVVQRIVSARKPGSGHRKATAAPFPARTATIRLAAAQNVASQELNSRIDESVEPRRVPGEQLPKLLPTAPSVFVPLVPRRSVIVNQDDDLPVESLDPATAEIAVPGVGPDGRVGLPATTQPPPLPGQAGTFNIPFRDGDTVVRRRNLELRMNEGLITLIANDAILADILSILASDHGLNLVTSETLDVRVTVSLHDVPLADALNAVLSVHGYSWARRNDIITVSRVSMDQPGGALVQGRMIRVYPLSFISANDMQIAIAGLLSPVGSVRSLMSDTAESRSTRDQLIVEDLPDYLARIDSCVEQLDQPPMQVLIEAHIFEVELTVNNRNGVNLEALTDPILPEFSFETTGFANPKASPSLLVGLDTNHLKGLIEALKTTTDARTLASPRVMVTHGQEARIQIGAKIGYRQSTTTETSTIQGVEFIDVGVVLTVTPYIGEGGRILLKVNPEVSDGQLNVETELPDERLTTVDSTVVLHDGYGMVIGGLIRESDDDQRSKTPILGETWMINRLFQLARHERARKEVIIALLPRIVYDVCPTDPNEQEQLDRVQNPLFYGPLKRNQRPWEPDLPEVLYRPPHIGYNLQEFKFSEGTRLTDDPALRSNPASFPEQPPYGAWKSTPVWIDTSPASPQHVNPAGDLTVPAVPPSTTPQPIPTNMGDTRNGPAARQIHTVSGGRPDNGLNRHPEPKKKRGVLNWLRRKRR
jgi:type II secretory pathway component GspD/PulD (secretin)